VGFTVIPVVRKRGEAVPFTLGATGAAGADGDAGTCGTGVFPLTVEVELEAGKTMVDVTAGGADFCAVEVSTSLPTRRRFVSAAGRGGDSLIRCP